MDSRDVDVSVLQDMYARIADEIGIENMLKIHELLKGEQVSFSMHLYSRERVIKSVKRDYDGTNLRQLADKYGYSRRWLRGILRDSGLLNSDER